MQKRGALGMHLCSLAVTVTRQHPLHMRRSSQVRASCQCSMPCHNSTACLRIGQCGQATANAC